MKKLIATESRIYDIDGHYICSIAMTERAKHLLNNYGWNKEVESWLSYRARTKKERESETEKQHQMAKDMVNAYNKQFGF